MKPWIKTLATHLAAIVGTAIAVIGWATSHTVDLYALWNQLNVVIAEIAKLIATLTPIATTIYGIWRSQPANRIHEIADDPKAIEVAKQMPVTPEIVALGDALKKA